MWTNVIIYILLTDARKTVPAGRCLTHISLAQKEVQGQCMKSKNTL